MERRQFLASSLAVSALAAAKPGAYAEAAEESAQGKGREFYQLRRYHINGGPQRKLCDDFFRDALLPALGRLKIGPVGVFDLTIGPETPSIYVLMPSLSAEMLATVENLFGARRRIQQSRGQRSCKRQPRSRRSTAWRVRSCRLLRNGRGSCLPSATASHGARIFEMRTYEGATDQDHKRKLEMMQSGEADIFTKAGAEQVFYGDTLIGTRLPNLTYMLAFASLADRDKSLGRLPRLG